MTSIDYLLGHGLSMIRFIRGSDSVICTAMLDACPRDPIVIEGDSALECLDRISARMIAPVRDTIRTVPDSDEGGL